MSSTYISQIFHCIPLKTSSIKRWNVEGALHKPKSNFLNSNKPSYDVNAVNCLEEVSIGI